jgi:hypothetical protein
MKVGRRSWEGRWKRVVGKPRGLNRQTEMAETAQATSPDYVGSRRWRIAEARFSRWLGQCFTIKCTTSQQLIPFYMHNLHIIHQTCLTALSWNAKVNAKYVTAWAMQLYKSMPHNFVVKVLLYRKKPLVYSSQTFVLYSISLKNSAILFPLLIHHSILFITILPF